MQQLEEKVTDESSIIEIIDDSVFITKYNFKNPVLVHLLKDKSDNEKVKLLTEIIEIGTIVYQRVQASSELDYVKRHFESFAGQLEVKILNLENAFKIAVVSCLSPDQDDSAAKKLIGRFQELHEGVKTAITDARKELQEDQTKLKTDIDKAFQDDGSLGKLLKQIEGFERKVAERFNPNDKTSFLGQIIEELKSYFDPKSGKVTSLLDSRLSFDNPESPFYKFAQGVKEDVGKLRGEIEAYRTAILGEDKLREEKEKGTQKGFDFEDQVEPVLEQLAGPFGDEVERVSTKGEPSGSKAGDFIYRFRDGWKLVIDAKDEDMTSLPKYKDILDRAMQERHADYGIILAKDENQLQQQVWGWNEYESNKLITSLPYLKIAINWVRLRQGLAANVQEGIDIEQIKNDIEKIKSTLKNLVQVRKQLTAIGNAKDSISSIIDSLDESISEGIDKILNHCCPVEIS